MNEKNVEDVKNGKTAPADNVVFVSNENGEIKRKKLSPAQTALIKKITVIGLLAVIVISALSIAGTTGWLSYERISLKFTDMFKGKSLEENTPIELNGLKVSDIDDIGYCFGVLDEFKYYVYSPECNLLYSFNHNMSAPITESSSKRVLMYERSNFKLKVFSRKGEVYEKNLENEIITADINEKNQVIVACAGERYLGEVKIFDSNGAEKLTWYSADNYITDAALSDDGKYFAVSLLRVENGETVSKIQVFKVGSAESITEQVFNGETFFDVRTINDGFVYVGMTKTAFVNGNGEITATYGYEAATLSYFTVSESSVTLIFEPEADGKFSGVNIDSSAKTNYTFKEASVDGITAGKGTDIYVCRNGKVFKLSYNGEKMTRTEVGTDGEAIKVLPKDEKLVILSISGINISENKEETEKG